MKSKIDTYVIEKVKEMRIRAKMSQEELSYKAGFSSNGFVGQVESSRYNKKYNIRHLNIFSSIFRCSPRDFLPEVPFLND